MKASHIALIVAVIAFALALILKKTTPNALSAGTLDTLVKTLYAIAFLSFVGAALMYHQGM